MTAAQTASALPPIAFVGGGNMASAILGGLRRAGVPATQFEVVEPFAATREQLTASHGVSPQAVASSALQRCQLVVWAVKPQIFSEAAAATRPFLAPDALHLSVAAGIPSDSIARWLGSERVVRAMPNTPALVGQGMTGLFARPAVAASERAQIEQLLQPTGQLVWVDDEPALDAVTAISGSGPAYVFYYIESMIEAGVEMGLSPAQAHALAVGTFTGASALAAASPEAPATLRERVTSKGGTTHAAISALEAAGVKAQFKTAIRAAEQRARELAQEFGKAG